MSNIYARAYGFVVVMVANFALFVWCSRVTHTPHPKVAASMRASLAHLRRIKLSEEKWQQAQLYEQVVQRGRQLWSSWGQEPALHRCNDNV